MIIKTPNTNATQMLSVRCTEIRLCCIFNSLSSNCRHKHFVKTQTKRFKLDLFSCCWRFLLSYIIHLPVIYHSFRNALLSHSLAHLISSIVVASTTRTTGECHRMRCLRAHFLQNSMTRCLRNEIKLNTPTFLSLFSPSLVPCLIQ